MASKQTEQKEASASGPPDVSANLPLSATNIDAPVQSSDELTAVVEELLNSLSNKFAGVSSEIFAKMDEMSTRLDNLEAQLKANQEATDAAAKQ